MVVQNFIAFFIYFLKINSMKSLSPGQEAISYHGF
jgi:hypothetical protein